MFAIIQTSFRESENNVAMAVRVENPLTGNRYTFSLGLTRDVRSDLDDMAAYSRRLEHYRRSIELSSKR